MKYVLSIINTYIIQKIVDVNTFSNVGEVFIYRQFKKKMRTLFLVHPLTVVDCAYILHFTFTWIE